MDNGSHGGDEEQSVTSPSGEYLGSNFHVKRFERIKKYPHRHYPGFGATREWNNDSIVSIFYQYEGLNSSVNKVNILCLLAE